MKTTNHSEAIFRAAGQLLIIGTAFMPSGASIPFLTGVGGGAWHGIWERVQ
jgi:hypothetical protein